jgi:transposase-like protein
MAWLETDVMKQRSLFVLDFDSGLFSMSELCERYGISRPTGYKWWARYCNEGLPALQDRSRRAHRCPHRTEAAAEEALVDLRRAHPGWGPCCSA